MASLLPDVLFEARGQAPAPSKDFYQLQVNRTNIVLIKPSLRWPNFTLKHDQQGSFTSAPVRWYGKFTISRLYACPWSTLKNEMLYNLNKHLPKKHVQDWTTLVVFRWWKISLRSEYREARPGELKESHDDFLDDPSLQIQIAYIFGPRTLDHIFNLCQGKFDFLARLPDQLLLGIVGYLDLEDISRLAQVSHRFERFCNSDVLWEMIVQNLCGPITDEMAELAREMGWKQFLFTNKLQLQLQLRRRRQKEED